MFLHTNLMREKILHDVAEVLFLGCYSRKLKKLQRTQSESTC